MNRPTRVIITSGKAALLASSLLSTGIVVLENEPVDSLPIIFFISVIITFIVSFFMILFTIVPFYELSTNLTLEQQFKRYFPFYSMLFFLTCFYSMYHLNFESISTLIFGIAYLTAMQSWVWFFKQKPTKS